MGCCHYYAPTAGGDTAFSVDVSAITFGPGVLAEAGDHVAARGIKRVALMTDKVMAGLDEHLASVRASLEAAGLDVVLYDEVRVEPTDTSFLAATEFARECGAEAFVSLGGGSVIDTCKAANLYASYPAEFLTYVNAPIGGGQPATGRHAARSCGRRHWPASRLETPACTRPTACRSWSTRPRCSASPPAPVRSGTWTRPLGWVRKSAGPGRRMPRRYSRAG